MENVDEDPAPREFLGIELVRGSQESAHMGEVGASQEGGEQPGAAGLGGVPPPAMTMAAASAAKEAWAANSTARVRTARSTSARSANRAKGDTQAKGIRNR